MTVRRLIATRPLTRTLGSALRAKDADEQHGLVGRVISNYRLVAELGRGGSGTVYLAERADHQFSGKAAVKVIDPTAALDLGLRFRAERQILATSIIPISRGCSMQATPRTVSRTSLWSTSRAKRWRDIATRSVWI